MKYYPSLDGIRALAVAVVLISHSGYPRIYSGWMGVDAFFTLSGFLITSILLSEYDRYGSIVFRNFYARRFLRLLPCLWLAVALVLAVWASFGQFEEVITDAVYALTYVMNWARAFGASSNGPLAHTWSLAIEEQYYLIWPLVIALACKFVKNRVGVGVGLLVASAGIVAYRYALADTVPDARIHYGLDTHADPMLIGSALACFASVAKGRLLDMRWSRLFGFILAPAAVVLLAYVLVFWSNPHVPPVLTVGYTVVAIGTAIVITDLTLGSHSVLRGLLSLSFLAWVGRISYGVYLYHFPIFKTLAHWGIEDWPSMFVLGIALTLGRQCRIVLPRRNPLFATQEYLHAAPKDSQPSASKLCERGRG